MKITNKQEKELNLVKWFIPEMMTSIEIKEEDIIKFFENSEQAKHKEEVSRRMMQGVDKADGFIALMTGKSRRDINIDMYITDFKQYRQQLAEIWCESQDFPDFVSEAIVNKIK